MENEKRKNVSNTYFETATNNYWSDNCNHDLVNETVLISIAAALIEIRDELRRMNDHD